MVKNKNKNKKENKITKRNNENRKCLIIKVNFTDWNVPAKCVSNSGSLAKAALSSLSTKVVGNSWKSPG